MNFHSISVAHIESSGGGAAPLFGGVFYFLFLILHLGIKFTPAWIKRKWLVTVQQMRMGGGGNGAVVIEWHILRVLGVKNWPVLMDDAR